MAKVSPENFCNNSMFSLFSVSISLTDLGFANWVVVVDMVFEYIRMLRKLGPQKWLFDELQRMAQIDYDFLDEGEEFDFVEGRIGLDWTVY